MGSRAMRAAIASALFTAPFVLAQDLSSSKRGLVYITEDHMANDDAIWNSDDSDLTWYYNYSPNPSPEIDAEKMEFVPMLWGTDGSEYFYSRVKGQVDRGANINYVLGFNEPDGCAYGGSCIDADEAASIWIDQIEPLKKLGISLGAPSPTGSPTGLAWMENFFSECDGNCNPDFFPAHWYGNFEGLASFLGQVNGTYPNMTLWVTEYAYPEGSLEDAQIFYNQSAEYFERLDFLTHYSYFGSFRSDVSNVGPAAAMLTQDGELTDIGAWYLGRAATGNKPKGGAGQVTKFAGWSAVVLAATLCIMA